MTWEFSDFERAAAELLPKTKSYEWAFRILRQAQVHGEQFAHRRERLLKRFVSRRKPYFVFQTSDGLRLMGDYRDRYSRRAALYPDEEGDLAHWIIEALDARPGAYVDVGSNMGILAAMVARARPDRQVIAIEAEPKTALRAAATFGLNKLANVKLIQAAVSDRTGEVIFYSPKGKSESASVVPLKGKKIAKIPVPAITIDSLQSQVDKVACLKLDVEGHEPVAMRGAFELIRRDRPTVIYEYHWDIAPRIGWTAEEIAETIRSCGPYEFKVVFANKDPYPFPPTREMGTVLNVIATPS